MAPTIQEQPLVPILSLEMLSESVLAGEEKNSNKVTLLPSVQLWHPASDWIFLLGVQFPFRLGITLIWGVSLNKSPNIEMENGLEIQSVVIGKLG